MLNKDLYCIVYFHLHRDRAWFVRLYREIIPSSSEGIIDHTGAQTMLYLTCIMISSVELLAHHRVSHAKDWLSVDCVTSPKGQNFSI